MPVPQPAFLAGIVMLMAIGWAPPPARSAPGPASSRPCVPLRIDPETTCLTGPKASDGTIDYLAAWNARAGKGIPADGNAGPLILAVCLPPDSPLAAAQAAAADIQLSQRDPHLKPCAAFKVDPADLAPLGAKPWQAAKHPAVAQWLTANTPALAALIQASRREHFFVPLVAPGHGGLCQAQVPYLAQLRLAGQALVCRAALRLGNGDALGAWSDVLAVSRLGRLLKSAPDMALYEGGVQLEDLGIQGLLMLARSAAVERATAVQILRDSLEMSVTPDPHLMLDVGERYRRLDALQAVEQGGTWRAFLGALARVEADGSQQAAGTDSGPDPALVPAGELPLAVDLNVLAAAVNNTLDLVIPVFGQGSYPAGRDVLQALEGSLKDRGQMAQRRLAEPGLAQRLSQAQGEDRRALLNGIAKDLFDRRLGGVCLAAYTGAYARRARLDLARLALALNTYYNDQGEYPPRLDILAPRYLPTLPQDPFTQQPYHYRRHDRGCEVWSVGPDGGNDQSNATADIEIELRPPA